MKNKKGDSLHIVIWVALVLCLALSSLFLFATSSGKVWTKVYDINFIDEFYLKENYGSFYLNEAGERALIETYSDFIDDGEYIYNAKIKKEYYIFENLEEAINEEFTERFIVNFKKEILGYEFEKSFLIDLQNRVRTDNFEINFVGNIWKLKIVDWKFSHSWDYGQAFYLSNLEMIFDLEKLELSSFDSIYEFKEKCVGLEFEEQKKCLENNNLDNFNLFVEGLEDYSKVRLESKNKYFIDNELRSIDIEFLM